MSQNKYALPKGSRILVTGANGYLGSNVVDLLLELGYNVRGTIRVEKPWLDELFEKRHGKGRYESAIVPDLAQKGACDAALEGIAGVVHVASDMSLKPDPNLVIPGVANATIHALESAAKHASVKRFVLTSSSAAVVFPRLNEKFSVHKDDWNEDAPKAAWSEDTPASFKPMSVYAAAKVESEQGAWKWVEEHKPGFVLNTVIPNNIFGRILCPEVYGSSMEWARRLFEGDDAAIKFFPPQWYIDVQDTARLHAIALLQPDVQAERLFAFASPFNWTDILAILAKLRPGKPLVKAPENEGRDLSEILPAKRAEELLIGFFGRGWTPIEDSIADGIADMRWWAPF